MIKPGENWMRAFFLKIAVLVFSTTSFFFGCGNSDENGSSNEGCKDTRVSKDQSGFFSTPICEDPEQGFDFNLDGKEEKEIPVLSGCMQVSEYTLVFKCAPVEVLSGKPLETDKTGGWGIFSTKPLQCGEKGPALLNCGTTPDCKPETDNKQWALKCR